MYWVRAVLFFLLFATPSLLAGLVWGGPWPPKQAIADGREKPETRWQGLSSSTGTMLIAAAVVIWFVPFSTIWVRYIVFIVIPLGIGVIWRRVMLRNERRDEQTT